MYERFTDRARKVMQFANQEAQRLNHEYVGTEHILLGLSKDTGGIGVKILEHLGVTLPAIRLGVEKLVEAGPSMVTMGKLPQTPRAKSVIQRAIAQSREMKHGHVGTEHILLGLLCEPEGIAAQVLSGVGVTMNGAIQAISEIVSYPPPPEQPAPTPVVPPKSIYQDFAFSVGEIIRPVVPDNRGRFATLQVIERQYSECPGEVQLSYACRAYHDGKMNTDLIRFNEVELQKCPQNEMERMFEAVKNWTAQVDKFVATQTSEQ